MNKTQFKKYITEYDFKTMFREELLWNRDNTKQPIVIEDETYLITGVAEKCGLKIVALQIDEIPSSDIRKKIDTQIRKLFHYYILILHNAERQVWLVPTKKNDKRELVTVEFAANQDTEFLYQKIIQLRYTLEDEETLTIVDVSKKVNDVFSVNSEKITTEFYKQFSIQHKAFRAFIEGIDTEVNKDWYASLMLNRLMFCYFIQKKRFLDNNINYLREKLQQVQALNTKSKKEGTEFYSFYKEFLLTLFHEGLGSPDNIKHKDLIGKIPYLNGGLFDTHELETIYGSNINISDKAFEKIFDFFDQYEWHLDTRITATGKDINPDVIGYIFEKYINDRAQMGAYYTKEDITEYISKNCILPYLFDETNRLLKTETIDIAAITKTSGDAYIYDAVKKGTQIPLPAAIEKGIKTVAHRNEWNKPATEQYALPTEIWRETVERRNRYNTINTKLQNGEVATINDFITYNLNIQHFTKTFLETTTNPQHIKCSYQALNSVTIIDPTCGSGAFLFAAMNILEPLYEICITRMEEFVNADKKGKHKYFEDKLAEINSPQHPNLQYYIYKTIILRNLYGVDIMKEAVEIAKLRLFLKLVATVDANFSKPNYGLEPLPDIDFNIRAGNTLVGFATEGELRFGLKWQLNFENEEEKINEKCDIVSKTFVHYKNIQLTYGDNYKEFKLAKDELNNRIKELNHELNIHLGKSNGVSLSLKENKQRKLLLDQKKGYSNEYIEPNSNFNKFLSSHQPFHWFAEFYEIINGNGGFDVVIGNPPYVEYNDSKSIFKVKDTLYKTYLSRNLYSFVFERAKTLQKTGSRIGMIIQISSVSTPSMETTTKEIKRNVTNSWISNFATRPAYLFEGVTMNLSIIISELLKTDKKLVPNIFATPYLRWNPEYREHLFHYLPFSKIDNDKLIFEYSIPKIKRLEENKILGKLISQKKTIGQYLEPTKLPTNQELFYRTAGGRYFKIFIDKEFGSESKSNKSKFFQKQFDVYVMIAILSSDIWWWYYTLHFDMYNCKDYMMYNFPFDYEKCDSINDLIILGKQLSDNLMSNAEKKEQSYATTGNRMQLIFRPSLSKPIIDEIDKVLAQHYGFTDEELDFIINYDIKYRIGKGLEADEE